MYCYRSGFNPWVSFGACRGMGAGAPWNSFGGGFHGHRGMAGWIASSMMRHAGERLGGCWSGHHGRCHGGWGADHSARGGAQGAGGWDSAKGGYVVGAGGRLNVDIQKSVGDKFKSNVQYRLGNGDWQDLGNSKDGGSYSIDARPGTVAQLRIQNRDGTYRLGSADNSDGRDHARVSSTANGVNLSVEDVSWDSSFDDFSIGITNGNRRR